MTLTVFTFQQLIQEGLRDTLDAYFGLIQVRREPIIALCLRSRLQSSRVHKDDYRSILIP